MSDFVRIRMNNAEPIGRSITGKCLGKIENLQTINTRKTTFATPSTITANKTLHVTMVGRVAVISRATFERDL